jgi:hypothetical protein
MAMAASLAGGTTPWRRAGPVLALLLPALLGVRIGRAADLGASVEYPVKAAFLLNFARFVEWPTPPGRTPSGIGIAVLGADPFGPSLEQAVAGKKIGRQGLRVTRAQAAHEVEAYTVLFVATSEMADWEHLRRELAGRPVLTVGDAPGFVKGGGMIGFYLEGNRVRFEVDPAALAASGLRLSSRVLELARITAGQTQGGGR